MDHYQRLGSPAQSRPLWWETSLMSLPALFPLSAGFLSLEHVRGILLLAFGFGFVVFFHELGHFLAAKWAGVKVEQFAVGFGQAVLAWRKGLGFRVGTTAKEFKKRLDAHLDAQDAQRQGGEPPLK